MKKALVLGSGLVAQPIIRYLLDHNIKVTVASNTPERAEKMINGHPEGHNIDWDIGNTDKLSEMISENDIVISLLPYLYHVKVAKLCISHKKNMVTTSYVKPEMKALDQDAKDAGIIILNELGLDPGIDHMSAMRIIDYIHNKGGSVEEFYSFCGALVAPEVEKNPFKYKFTWAPKGVVMAGNNDGNYLRHGKTTYIPTQDLFKKPLKVNFPDIGELEVYPNRDSLPYIDLYGIPETKTIMRGTFRYDRWCENIDAMKSCGLLSDKKLDLRGLSYGEMLGELVGAVSLSDVRDAAAKHLGIRIDSPVLDAFEWLGLFSGVSMDRQEDSPFEVVSDLMLSKMMVGEKERDMVVMQHTFLASYPDGKKEVIKSRMLDFGSLETDTSIARTVALPAAVGVRMILEGEIHVKGVHIPVIPEIYNPILDALEHMNIKMIEEYGLPESENII
jgi:saccharopine dehydrogenase-like NADP-dependent oxidoreductase